MCQTRLLELYFWRASTVLLCRLLCCRLLVVAPRSTKQHPPLTNQITILLPDMSGWIDWLRGLFVDAVDCFTVCMQYRVVDKRRCTACLIKISVSAKRKSGMHVGPKA